MEEKLVASGNGERYPHGFYPWRRFWARTVDQGICGLFWIILSMVFLYIPTSSMGVAGKILDTAASLFLMLLLEPVCLMIFGTTPGKGIFGIQVTADDGSRLTYGQGLRRTWGVIWRGMGFSIPIVSLVCGNWSYKRCADREIQPWDEGCRVRVLDDNWYRWLLFAAAEVITCGAVVLTVLYAPIAPNHGQVTVAEFAENYNYLAEKYSLHQEGWYLGADGSWQEKDDTYEIIGLGGPLPEFSYETDEYGQLTGISMRVETEGVKEVISSYENHMVLAALAYAGVQKGAGGSTGYSQAILKEISSRGADSHSFTQGGIALSWKRECQGYQDYRGFVSVPVGFYNPDEQAERQYYLLEFDMKKLEQ